jgi:hypothetical protein
VGLSDAAVKREARDRAAFVAAACGGDEALRQQVGSAGARVIYNPDTAGL